MKQPGFMIYAEDWACYTEDYTDEELGRMLRALLDYFDGQAQPTFADRGMRQFFRLASRGIDLDRKRYSEKCRQNAYIRYKGICRQQHEKPLSFEAWEEMVNKRREAATDDHQTSPDVTGGHQTSPDVTGGHQTSPNVTGGHQTSPNVTGGHQTSPIPAPAPAASSQPSTVKDQRSAIKHKQSVFNPSASASGAGDFGPPLYRPLPPDDFEKQRERMLASLRALEAVKGDTPPVLRQRGAGPGNPGGRSQ